MCSLFLFALFVGCYIRNGRNGSDGLSGGTFTEDASLKQIQKEFSLKDFEKLHFWTAVHVKLVQSDTYKVSVSVSEVLQDHLEVKQHGSTLGIGLHDANHDHRGYISAEIHLPKLTQLHASGVCEVAFSKIVQPGEDLDLDFSGAASLSGSLEVSNKVHMDFSGSSDVDLNVQAGSVDLETSGSSDVTADTFDVSGRFDVDMSGSSKVKITGGSAAAVVLSNSGSSKFLAKSMRISTTLDVDLAGASHAEVTADGDITLDISGGSKLYLYGKGSVIKQSVSGAAKIQQGQ